MAGPGLRPGELREASTGCLLPSSAATGRQDTLDGAPSSPPRPRPCQPPGSSSLFLSSSVQEPVRKPQNTELQEAAGEVKEPGAADHSVFFASCYPSPGPRIPALSPRPDPRFLPSAIPLRVLSSPTRGLQQPPPGCGEH